MHSFVVVFFQNNPNEEAKVKAILSCDNNQIFIQDQNEKKLYKGFPLFQNGIMILPDNNRWLKFYAQSNTISQMSYIYTEDYNEMSKYLAILHQGEEN